MMKIYIRKRAEMTRTHTHTCIKINKKGLTETRTRIKENKYLYLIRLTLLYCCLPTKLQKKLSKLLKIPT